MKGTAPEITMATGYPMYKDIVLTFEDSTRAYQANITAKINETNVSATYLDRTEPGKLTIKASYFATGRAWRARRVYAGTGVILITTPMNKKSR